MHISDTELLILSSFLISISFFLETFSFLGRVIGYEMNMASSGYSFHVQISTFARLGTLIGMPIIGLIIDNNNLKYLILFPFFVSIFFLVSTIFCLYYFKKVYNLTRLFFGNRFKIKVTISKSNYKFTFNREIFTYGFVAYFFVNMAFFLIPVLAVNYYNNRAFILQLSGLTTGIGTFIGIFYFDHKLSIYLDNTSYNLSQKTNVIKNVILSRILTMTLMFILSIISYVYYR